MANQRQRCNSGCTKVIRWNLGLVTCSSAHARLPVPGENAQTQLLKLMVSLDLQLRPQAEAEGHASLLVACSVTGLQLVRRPCCPLAQLISLLQPQVATSTAPAAASTLVRSLSPSLMLATAIKVNAKRKWKFANDVASESFLAQTFPIFFIEQSKGLQHLFRCYTSPTVHAEMSSGYLPPCAAHTNTP